MKNVYMYMKESVIHVYGKQSLQFNFIALDFIFIDFYRSLGIVYDLLVLIYFSQHLEVWNLNIIIHSFRSES
jgi:hypothetical protein